MNVWGCGGGWEKRKISRSCVKFDSFSSQGFSLTNFSFSSCRFPSCREKLWLSGWKKLNGAETKLFDVLSDWVGEKTEVGRLPQPHSNFSHKNWLTSRVLWFLVIFPPSQTHAEFWRQSLMYLANLGGPFPKPGINLGEQSKSVREEGQSLPWKTHPPQSVTLLTFLESALEARKSGQQRIWVRTPPPQFLSVWIWVG